MMRDDACRCAMRAATATGLRHYAIQYSAYHWEAADKIPVWDYQLSIAFDPQLMPTTAKDQSPVLQHRRHKGG